MNNTLFNNHNTGNSDSPYGQNNGQPLLDPSLGFNNINPNALDFSHLQNPLLQQRLNDARPASQAQNFQHSPYNVNSVVPAKRPRPGEDNVAASPRPQGQQGASRSQTPQHPGFSNAFANQQPMSQVPNPYQHLQQQANTSNHATPSPVPPNQQQFSQPSQPPTSNSPHQFNQNFGNFPHMQNRSNAPQNANNPAFMRGSTPQNAAGVPNGAMADATRQYQLKLQQHAQLQAQQQLQGNNMMQNRQQGQQMGPTPNNGPQMDRNMQAQMQAQSRGQVQGEQGFMKSLIGFLSQRGISLEPEPKICGRQINYFHLFQEASKKSVILPNANPANWSLVAAAMGFPPNQFPSAADEAKNLFQRNLMAFSQTWAQMVQKRKMAMMQQQQQQKQQQLQQQQQQQQTPGAPGGPQNQPPQQPPLMGGPAARQTQMSPPQAAQQFPQGSPVNDASQAAAFQPPAQFQAPTGSQAQISTPVQAQSAGSPIANGLFTPQGQTLQNEHADLTGRQRSGSSAQPATRPTASPQVPQQTPPGSGLEPKESPARTTPQNAISTKPQSPAVQVDVKPDQFRPKSRLLSELRRTPGNAFASLGVVDSDHGGLPIDSLKYLGNRLADLTPGVPTFEEMATVDIHALTMSIQSGIRAEVRYALDQIVGLSHDVRVTIPLHECEILVESLIECGEDHLERLSEGLEDNKEPSNLPLVEDLAKDITRDGLGVQNHPPFGTREHEMNSAANRLIAITTILRNLSCPDHLANHEILARPLCINFLASIIRGLSTYPNLLCNAQNTQDVMKDIVTMLSQISHRLEIQNEEDAIALLQLLVSFAPAPAPVPDPSSKTLTFTPYDPKKHQYLPSAIDALAKLLARDDPNRTYFKSIFASEPIMSNSAGPHNLLTRAFALAIAPIPDRHAPHIDPSRGDLIRLAHLRNPFFTQGMLAADILASLAPGQSDPLARSWLESEDGWAPSLLHLLFQLSHDRSQGHGPRHPNAGKSMDWEMRGVSIITMRGLSMLRRLAEKVDRNAPENNSRTGLMVNGTATHTSGRESKSKYSVLAGVLPGRDAVLRALTDSDFEPGALRQLMAFAALDG